MKSMMLVVLFCALSQSAFAMPCDAGYDCVSKGHKYKVSLQRCRYRNSIHLLETKINDVEVSGASLNQGWDGDSVLAFEINLPTPMAGAVKLITAELSKKQKMGIMKILYAASEPGPLEVIHTEKISCHEVE